MAQQITKEQLINDILREKDNIGMKPYSHNIVSIKLKMLEEYFGSEEVEKIVRESDLKYMGWGHIIGYEVKEIEYESSSEEDSYSSDDDDYEEEK